MLSVDFINVGYGDSILVRDTGKPRRDCLTSNIQDRPFTLLIDSGDTSTGRAYQNSLRISTADFLKLEGITTIDVFLLTHLHRDHIGGFPKVMENTTVKELWINCLPGSSMWKTKIPQDRNWDTNSRDTALALNLYLDMLDKLHAKGTGFKVLNSTGDLRFFSMKLTEKLLIECTFADSAIYHRQNKLISGILSAGKDKKNVQCEYPHTQIKNMNLILNDTSIRTVLKYKDAVIALPGDASASSWIQQPPQKCTILKTPHHGHRDGMSEELISFLKPEYFVLSVSNDREDPCPHPDSINIIKQCAKKCFVTDALSIPGVTEKTFHSSVRFEFDDRLVFAGSHIAARDKIGRDNYI